MFFWWGGVLDPITIPQNLIYEFCQKIKSGIISSFQVAHTLEKNLI